jgi:hypothetical protein
MIIPSNYKDRIKHFLIEFNDEFERTNVDVVFCQEQLKEVLLTFEDYLKNNPPKDWYDYHGISIIRRGKDND